MEVAMPISGSAIDCYEDMFKEITRKLYGEDGLSELNVGERITSVPERNSQISDYEIENPLMKTEDHLTALGLAALMQNGFPTNGILNTSFSQHKNDESWIASEDNLSWSQSKIATYNQGQKTFKCVDCDCVGNLARIAEHWLGTHSNLRAFRCPQCPYESAWARCVKVHLNRHHNIEADEASINETLVKNNPVLQDITKYLQRLKSKLDLIGTSKSGSQEEYLAIKNDQQNIPNKRYNCTFCPYATDRRDLFTRHENIHREEKPFQCYVCQKQFNRADHVKKHFLRMHREHPYDLNRIRRHPPKNASGMSYYQKYNSNPPPEMNNSLTIPSGLQSVVRQSTSMGRIEQKEIKNITSKSSSKKRTDKRFTCCYCSWSGVDNWCLKRHMNTHLKPFVCVLCDYKAARSERLATHVLKVHNKRVCVKCSFLADDQAQLSSHQQEHHPLEQRNRFLSNTAVLRPNPFNTSMNPPSCSQNLGLLKPNIPEKSSKSSIKQHGAARLFNYMEASDDSEPESETRPIEDINRVNISHRMQDFPEAGDVAERREEEPELPLFICPSCGCEFEDDISLDTHQYTHRIASSPAKNLKENVNPTTKFKCKLCEMSFENQSLIVKHMDIHSTLTNTTSKDKIMNRKRKQNKPQRIFLPSWDSRELRILINITKTFNANESINLKEKYIKKLVIRKRLICHLCPKNKISRYHTKGSLILHQMWRHQELKFKCEHCDSRFKHRYQVVLHGGRVHAKNTNAVAQLTTSSNYSSLAIHSTTLHDVSSISKFGELGMAMLDHSFMQSNNSISHLPIIIPTFPPS